MKTAEQIIKEAFDRIPDDLSKREGDILYLAIAPIAQQMEELYYFMEMIRDTTIPDTSICAGDNLTRKCAEHGVNRYPATKAIRHGVFRDFNGSPVDIAIGSRYGADGLSYITTERISSGEYRLECETPGIIGNNYFGPVLPLDLTHQLGTAVLAEVLIPGEDEETDETLRERFYIEVNAQPYGGNIDQYKKWVLAISGVGNVRVFPTPNNQGGRVHLVIVAPENKPASTELIEAVEQTIDPQPYKGKGLGLAPINHYVTVSSVAEAPINVSSEITLAEGFSVPSILSDVQKAITEYLAKLSFEDNVVRVALIEATILAVNGVRDIKNTMLNGAANNIYLPEQYNNYQVPVLGDVTLTPEGG